ncbi:MAG TPA: PDZ domain-containing protein [Xanthobacteraceae bacterium]|nr:PDZ domain-containing protein [Xanthobacteraceae bacterium]
MSLPRIRIFISSPRDVGSERALAMRVLERLQLEFRGRVELAPIFWEHEVLKATDTFQSQIPRAAEADLCVFILWSWFGTPLPEDFRRPDGSTFRSGTEFEFEDAVTHFRERGSPDILVYRKTADVAMPTRDRTREMEWRAQRDALHEFVDRWFRGEGGTFKAAFQEFEKQQQFEDLFETHLRRWIESRLIASLPAGETQQPSLWQGSPYRGLEHFDFNHALIYCGRTQAVAEAIDALRRMAEKGTPFLLVAGMSGAGKSSFVRAGVLPMLIQPRVIEGDIAWRWAAMRPGDVADNPLESIAAALLADEALPELAEGGISRSELAAMLGGRVDTVLPILTMALARAASTRAGGPAASAKLVLVVDQLDEIFTQAAIEPATRNAFAEALAALARSGKVWVILTLRSDLFARMAELPAAFCELARGDGFYELRAPSPAEIGQMIRRPARIASVRFERRGDTDEALDDVLRDAAAAQPASLPLLQFALDELSKACAQTKVLTFAAYEALGGLEGALRARAEATISELSSTAQSALSPVIARLVQVRLDGAVGQIRAAKAGLDAIPGGTRLVDAFVAARLFVVDRGADGEPVVGVAHEALLREWPRVRDWIEENRAVLNARARIVAAQALWSAADRGDVYLLPAGRLLQEGEALLKERRALISDSDADFIEASLQRAARERLRGRLRWAAAAAVLVFVAAGGAFYWDAYHRDHANSYGAMSRRWGVFTGVGLLSDDQARARSLSFRIHTHGRFGPIYRMEAVNGAGYCPMVSALQLFIGGALSAQNFTSKRTCAWEFEVDAGGRARSEQGLDFMGRPVYMFRYSDKDATTAEYYNADGFASSGSSSGASRIVFERVASGPLAGLEAIMRFKDAYGRPKQNHQRIYGVRNEFDNQGRPVRTTNLDRNDRPMPDNEGIVTLVQEYNERGEVVSRSFLDVDGRPARAQAGFFALKIAYDTAGNESRHVTHDIDGTPLARPEGYAETRYTYDKRGNIELIAFFDGAGQPTRIQSGESRVRRASDSRGWLTELTYLDENDKPILTTGGSAMDRYEYDAESNLTRLRFFDLQGTVSQQTVKRFADGLLVYETYLDGEGRPAPRAMGHSAVRMAYRNGRETERVYLDGDDHPFITTRKFAKQVTTYDERGSVVEVAYRDDQDRPVLSDDGYATVKRRFNELGDPEEEIYLGIDDAPRPAASGYAKVRTRHDEHGRGLEVRYFAADDRPVWPDKACAFNRTFDPLGRVLTTLCIRDGMPAPHPDGWTRRDMLRDVAGNIVREGYFDGDGMPVRETNGVARWDRSYDAWGNIVDQAFFDERGAALNGPNGCQRIAQEFSRVNSIVGEKCLAADGTPAERNDGVHRVVIDRDAQDRVTLRTFHMLRIPRGWPTRVLRQYRDAEGRFRRAEYVDDNGVVRLVRDLDEHTRVTETAYFDEQGRPQRGTGGFAKSRVLAFDEFGGADMEFQDEGGNPVEPLILVTAVKDGGPGARAGIRANDLILRYDGRAIHYGQFAAAQRLPGTEKRELVIWRGNATEIIQVEPGPLQIESEPLARP